MKSSKWMIAGALAAATCGTVAFQASAGAKITTTVTVDTANRTFSGSLGSARNSSNSVEYVYCDAFTSVGSVSATCGARNSAGVSAVCSTNDAALVTAIGTITTDSYVRVSYSATGTCSSIRVVNSSQHAPKVL